MNTHRFLFIAGIAFFSVIAGRLQAETIGVLRLSDGRQFPNLSLLDPAMSAARNALTADGHSIVPVEAITAAQLAAVDVLWLPLLETSAVYTEAERYLLRQYFDNGGRLFWIGDAGIYNLGDDSFLSRFGITKLADTFDTAGPVLNSSSHPITSGPFGLLPTTVATQATFGLMNLSTASVPAVTLYSDAAGPGAFVALLHDQTAGGRAALVCDSAIFADALDENGGSHRLLLRNLVAWLAESAGYTASGSNVMAGPFQGACDACPALRVTFTQVNSTGLTSASAANDGDMACGVTSPPFGELAQDFAGFTFQIATTAVLPAGAGLTITIEYNEAGLADAGLRDESALEVFWYDPVAASAVNVTTSRNTMADTITATAPAPGMFLLGTAIPSDDCDHNGRPDVCEIDATSLAPGGPFYCVGDCDADCNENGILDTCDVRAHVNVMSPVYSPIGAGAPATHEFTGVSRAIGNVMLEFSARGDLSAASEYIDVRLNNSLVGRVFETGGVDCQVMPGVAQLNLSAASFNTLTASGIAKITMTPSSAVDPNLCNPPSGIQVRLVYEGESLAADCNVNGIPDDCEPYADCNANGTRDLCEIATGAAADCNGNNVPDACDLAGGESEDCNANELPDECEGPFAVTIARENASGGSVQPLGTADRGVCEVIELTAAAANGYCFGGWTVSEGVAPADPSAMVTSVVADMPKTVTGHFTKIISADPQNAIGCPGGSIVLSVLVDPTLGAGTSYQWRRNGVNVTGAGIAGATGPELMIAPLAPEHAGTYDCVVTMSCGSAVSAPAALTVGSDTALVTDIPPVTTACLGGTVALTMAASGQSVAYQWQYAPSGDAFTDLQNDSGVSGASSATLVLSNVTSTAAGRYRCIATGTCGSPVTSSVTQLTVGEPPEVMATSGDATICEGEAFSASVSVSGAGASCEWYFLGGTVWVPAATLGSGIEGANTPFLTITNTLPAHSGLYRCVVSGACDPQAQSQPIRLTVQQATRILEQPVSQSRCPGQAVMFSVGPVGTQLAHQWQFDGGGGFANIPANAPGIAGTTSSILSIAAVNPAHAGQYRCVVTGSCGSTQISDSAALLISMPAVLVDNQLPLDESACPGGRAVMQVEATGDGLTYQWQANTGPAFVSLSDGPNVSGAKTDTLVLTGVSVANSGLYQCVVVGACGAAQVSRAAVLSITNQVCDCNENGVDDAIDISSGSSADCNQNGVPDACEISAGSSAPHGPFFCTSGCAADCNENGVPDTCEITAGAADCNANGVLDECEMPSGGGADCNANGTPDSCDIASGDSEDCNHNGVPDECEPPFVVDAGPDVSMCSAQVTAPLGPCAVSGSRAPYSYQWQILSGPAGASVQQSTTAAPIFRATTAGDYVVGVTVSDSSNPPCVKTDSVFVHVYEMRVTAGADLSLGVGQVSAPLGVQVEGAMGDVSYEWRIEPGSASLNASQFGNGGPLVAHPTFQPDTAGVYTIRVTVRDANTPDACVVSDTIVIHAVLMTIAVPDDFAMCVSGTSEPLNVVLTSPGTPPFFYDWTIVAGSPSLSVSQWTGAGAQSPNPTFTPMAAGAYELIVTVRDSSQPPAVATGRVHVYAGGLQVSLPTEMTICAQPGGLALPRPETIGGVEPLTYLWSIEPGAPSDDPSLFTGENAFDARWTFKPASPGAYTLRLTTRDSATPPCVRSNLLNVRATAMTVDAGRDFVTPAFSASVPLGGIPVAAGAGSGTTYHWRILNGPSTDAGQLSDVKAARPLFTPLEVGTYAIEVIATDDGCSATDVVVVESIASKRAMAVNAEGRLFMALRLGEAFAAADVRITEAPADAQFSGELRDEGKSAVTAGMAKAGIGRRLTLNTDLKRGEFVAVVGMLFAADEADMPELLQVHAWDNADGLWRRAVQGKVEHAPMPARPGRNDIGRAGFLAAPNAGDDVYMAWVVVDYSGRFCLGQPDGAVAAFPADRPGAGDSPAPGESPTGLVNGGGLCGAGGATLLLTGMLTPFVCRRPRRARRQ